MFQYIQKLKARLISHSQGVSLLEVVVALGLLAILTPALGQVLVGLINWGDQLYERSLLMELAQSQLESLQSQAYQTNVSNYSIITTPSGYSISLSGEVPVPYSYPAPASVPTAETLQKFTITVTGVRASHTGEGYKVRR